MGERLYVDYVNEFCALVRDLVARRSVWAEIAPYDDPMRYDETALRELEALVLEDLLGAGASEEQLRAAHCWGELRLQSRPPCRVVETSQCVVAAMKERYERVCGEMCHIPASPVIAAFQTKLRLLSYLCEQKQKPDYRPLPLDDVHRDLARLRKESDVPRRVTPMGDSEESEEDTSADSVSDECLDDAGPVPRLVIQKEVNQELMNRRLAYKEKKHGWVLCQSQACGGAVANSISRDSQLIWGNYVSEFGIRCPCHKELFCSIKCLSQHMKIRLPTRPEEGISDQQRSVLDEYRHIKQSLHLFLAYLHRHFGTSRELAMVEEGIEEMRNPLSPSSRGKGLRKELDMYQSWYASATVKFDGYGTSIDSPPRIISEARDLVRHLRAEHRRELADLATDDVDYEWKEYKILLAAILKGEGTLDALKGWNLGQINQHQEKRMKVALRAAIQSGALSLPYDPKEARFMTEKGDFEFKRNKQRKESRRRANVRKKEDSLKVVGHLCVWYVQVLALRPADHYEERKRLKEWQRLMEKEDPEAMETERVDFLQFFTEAIEAILSKEELDCQDPLTYSVKSCYRPCGPYHCPCGLPDKHDWKGRCDPYPGMFSQGKRFHPSRCL